MTANGFDLVIPEGHLVIPKDKRWAAAWVLAVAGEIEPCQITCSNREQFRIREGNIGVGLMCKHCRNWNSAPGSVKDLQNAVVNHFLGHVTRSCEAVPPDIKQSILTLINKAKDQRCCKRFWGSLWSRLCTQQQRFHAQHAPVAAGSLGISDVPRTQTSSSQQEENESPASSEAHIDEIPGSEMNCFTAGVLDAVNDHRQQAAAAASATKKRPHSTPRVARAAAADPPPSHPPKRRRHCSIPGCGSFSQSHGVCQRHGAKVRRCVVPDCTKQARSRCDGMCKYHFNSLKSKPRLCAEQQRFHAQHALVAAGPLGISDGQCAQTTASQQEEDKSAVSSESHVDEMPGSEMDCFAAELPAGTLALTEVGVRKSSELVAPGKSSDLPSDILPLAADVGMQDSAELPLGTPAPVAPDGEPMTPSGTLACAAEGGLSDTAKPPAGIPTLVALDESIKTPSEMDVANTAEPAAGVPGLEAPAESAELSSDTLVLAAEVDEPDSADPPVDTPALATPGGLPILPSPTLGLTDAAGVPESAQLPAGTLALAAPDGSTTLPSDQLVLAATVGVPDSAEPPAGILAAATAGESIDLPSENLTPAPEAGVSGTAKPPAGAPADAAMVRAPNESTEPAVAVGSPHAPADSTATMNIFGDEPSSLAVVQLGCNYQDGIHLKATDTQQLVSEIKELKKELLQLRSEFGTNQCKQAEKLNQVCDELKMGQQSICTRLGQLQEKIHSRDEEMDDVDGEELGELPPQQAVSELYYASDSSTAVSASTLSLSSGTCYYSCLDTMDELSPDESGHAVWDQWDDEMVV
jgi:hypothetical protein